MIKVTVEGVDYDFDEKRLLLAEAREIKTFTGMSPARMFGGLDEGDPDSIAAIVFLTKKRAGETLRWSDLDRLNYADIQMDFGDASGDAEGDQPEQAPAAGDPTPPSGSGTTPTDGTGATSEPSPTASSTTPTQSAV